MITQTLTLCSKSWKQWQKKSWRTDQELLVINQTKFGARKEHCQIVLSNYSMGKITPGTCHLAFVKVAPAAAVFDLRNQTAASNLSLGLPPFTPHFCHCWYPVSQTWRWAKTIWPNWIWVAQVNHVRMSSLSNVEIQEIWYVRSSQPLYRELNRNSTHLIS